MTPDRPTGRSQLSRGARWAIAAGGLIVIAIVAVAVAAPALSPYVKSRVTKTLEENFASRLELKSLDVSLFPSVRVSGDGLVLRQKEGGDIPPLIIVNHFTAETNLLLALFSRIQHVRLDGLQIHIQTGRDKQPGDGAHKKPPGFTIAEVIADGARLETIPSKPGKDPLVWDIKKLTLHHVTPDSPMSFDATLTNALPPGDIQSSGNFGPWQREHPSQTPVSGSYTFRHADLSVFHGISGMLSSDGKYNGVLERIEAQGHTDTPDFAVSIAGNKVDLTTDFHAIIDGTNGTTQLQPVVAKFGHSTLTANGIVDTTPGRPGKVISLDVRPASGRLEDMLRMAVKGKPPMTGRVAFHTKLLLPARDVDVIQKLQLDGAFDVDAARFSQADSQQKVDKLSNRGRGQTDDAADDSVASNFRGSFSLRNGMMHFTDLSFNVPGVAILLNGDYSLEKGEMDLRGTARLQAKLSETTTGFKSFLLKAVDPFFQKKNAGTELPIKITGSQDSPSFGLNIGGKDGKK